MMLHGKMSQVTLKKSDEDVTGRMGIGWIRHSMEHFGLEEMIDRRCPMEGVSNREISASRKVMAGALSIIAGAQRIEDLEVLRADKGLLHGLGWKSMISPDTLREYLKVRRNGGRLRKINDEFSVKMMRESVVREFTFDNDATYFDSEKDSAEYSYQLRRQYSGLLGFIAELKICNTVDFRPGNISPATGILNQLRKAAAQAKSAGKRIARFRSDSAAHQGGIFEFCERESIRYFISLDKNAAVMECIRALKAGMWRSVEDPDGSLERKTEWAESVYVTNKESAMRMLVLRWLNPKPDLFEPEKYCYHAIGTNDNEIEAMAWLEFHNGRMGSEQFNGELKEGLNASYTPSHDFEMDRGYFLLNVLAYNILQCMKLFYLGSEAGKWTVKTLRYWFVDVCGKIVRSGRKYYCKILNATPRAFALFQHCWSALRVA